MPTERTSPRVYFFNFSPESKSNVVALLIKKNSESGPLVETTLAQTLKQQEEELDASFNKKLSLVNGYFDLMSTEVCWENVVEIVVDRENFFFPRVFFSVVFLIRVSYIASKPV